MQVYAGIDLHSNNSYLALIDEDNRRLFDKRLPNKIGVIEDALTPFKEQLVGVVVESTFNWYWLVDGLAEAGYRMHLANPAAIEQYEGLKHGDDRTDAFWLATMLKLGILPEGYIYPKAERPVRDMLRRRLFFVRQRTAQILSLQSMVRRHLGQHIGARQIKQLKEKDTERLFDDPYLVDTAVHNIATIRFLHQRIKAMEKTVLAKVKLRPEFSQLLTVPGIGKVLGLTIMLEVGTIRRFAKVGNYASYCRCVKSSRLSNQKCKGRGNHKNGNKYLSWAYVEAAHFIVRYNQSARRYYQRKKARTCGALATKALSHKLARASYYIMRDKVAFDEVKLFG